MPRKRQDLTEYENKISLASQISFGDKHVIEYVGSNTEYAESVAILNVMVEFKLIAKKDVKLMIRLLQEQNKANFWSNVTTDVFSKLGAFKPQKHEVKDFGKPNKTTNKVVG